MVALILGLKLQDRIYGKKNQINLEKKTCSQCRYFTYLNPHVCETLNLARNPLSLLVRLRLGYGACLRKKKMVKHRTSVCSDYQEREYSFKFCETIE
jgi:RNA polymerase subunit RPABC4/transcription elongation factor Spt4